jgi:hypothetical protein
MERKGGEGVEHNEPDRFLPRPAHTDRNLQVITQRKRGIIQCICHPGRISATVTSGGDQQQMGVNCWLAVLGVIATDQTSKVRRIVRRNMLNAVHTNARCRNVMLSPVDMVPESWVLLPSAKGQL